MTYHQQLHALVSSFYKDFDISMDVINRALLVLLTDIQPAYVGESRLPADTDHIMPSPYGTISIDWQVDDHNFLSLEVGKTKIAFFGKLKATPFMCENIPNSEVLATLRQKLSEIYA